MKHRVLAFIIALLSGAITTLLLIPANLSNEQLWSVFFVGTGTTSIYAIKMLHRNAEQLVAFSHRVFIGVCISVEEKEIP